MEPEHAAAEPIERDRLAVHAGWEAVLLVALGAAAALVWTRSGDALAGDQLRDQLVLGAGNVLLASAFALSLRAAAPNLAAGGIVVAAGALTGWLLDEHRLVLASAGGIAAGAAVLVGLVMGGLVTGLRVPAWAVTIGAAVGLSAATGWLLPGGPRALPATPDLSRWAWPLFGAAAVLSVAGGAIGANARVRSALGRWRYHGGPVVARDDEGGGAGLVVVGALALSCLLAAGAGLVFALRQHAAGPDSGAALLTTVAAFGAALLGGTSVHGRRGGVFGTVLAAGTVQLLLLWMDLGNVAGWIEVLTVAGAVLVGLGVSRMVEWLGRPGEPEFVETMPLGDPDAYPTRYVDLM